MPTPPERGRPTGRSVIEPTWIQRRRRTEALAELVRQVREEERGRDPDEGYESVPPPPLVRPPLPSPDTEELPPVPGATARGGARSRRRSLAAAALAAAALAALALLPPGRDHGDGARPGAAGRPPAAPAAPAPAGGTDPDGAGTLREGDTGPAVLALQQRLLRVPDVYRDGRTDGTFDAPLAAAVARFQLWYGIRGDESGVYGDDTRADLESRTSLP
ncbi:peptidoglycan-binding protein [Streptomyces sp. NPDC048566]|uniref:peptidoglycan-binding domain-containing protein n=1 Tax=Streptomyces sp. NPDC048566 TaxID=3365569 RepID=UPI003721F31A